MDISPYPTPNPNAFKFILDKQIIMESNVSFSSKEMIEDMPLIEELFKINKDIIQIYLFANVITITKDKDSTIDWEILIPEIIETIEIYYYQHDINFNLKKNKKNNHTDKNLIKIQNILDDFIIPYLQADGGNLECLNYQDNILLIRYAGACGTCPSSTTGTLNAIEKLLKDEFNPDIKVLIQD